MNTISPNIILGAVIVFGVLLITLIGIIATYIFVIQKAALPKKTENEDEVDSGRLTAEVHAKSLKILEEAHKKAREVLSNAENFMARDESRISEQIEKISKMYVEKYESSLGNIKLEAIKTIHTIPKDINELFSKALGDFQDNLETEIGKAREKLAAEGSESLKSAQNEIEKYKAKRMREVDASIIRMVKDIAKKALFRDMSALEHEKLVLKALEEAKKEGIFE